MAGEEPLKVDFSSEGGLRQLPGGAEQEDPSRQGLDFSRFVYDPVAEARWLAKKGADGEKEAMNLLFLALLSEEKPRTHCF